MADAVRTAPAQTFSVPPRLGLSPGRLRGILSVIGAALLWELAGRTFLNNPLFFVPLSAVIMKMGSLWQTGELQTDILTSLQEFVIGFGLAMAVGILVGTLMASFKAFGEVVDPWVSMLYATPFVAIAPLLTLWLGIGLSAHVAVVFLVAVFPILINTCTGLGQTDPALVEVGRSYGASRWQIFTKIQFPSALPFIVAGLRQGVARGLVGVVVAELFGSKNGLGYLILISGQQFDAAGLFVGILLFALAGVASVELLRAIERWMAPWRQLGEAS